MNTTRKLTVSAILIAFAYISLLFIRIPIIPAASFLRLDIKDVFIAIVGLLFGPLSAFGGAVGISLLQMFGASEYGFIGFAMNTLSVAAYTVPLAAIYNKRKSKKALLTGLLAGSAAMIATMLLWNYLITPLYMGVTREAVASMLLPVFLPFNAIKAGVDSALVMLLWPFLAKHIRRWVHAAN